jgi:hypothetical protein
MRVTHLFLKSAHQRKLTSVGTLAFTTSGLADNVACQPLRQVLISSLPISKQCGLRPGDLRENVVVDFPDLYELPSGTILRIGKAAIRLTFHCEPCKGILAKVPLKTILHKRGVLGCFLNSGTIRVSDELSIAARREESIPYDIKERIRWYLGRQSSPMPATKLIYDLGLSYSYLRALPALLRKTPDIDSNLVIFTSRLNASGHEHQVHSAIGATGDR